MDCKTFHELLSAYVSGKLLPDRFEQMVTHEADCEACHAAATEAMDASVTDAGTGADPEAVAGFDLAADEAWVRDTLSRTVGADCTYIELQLAARLDATRPAELSGLIRQHLQRCEHCREFAVQMGDLPEYYAALPRLHADAGFVRDVVGLTRGARAGFRDVMRALLARPSFLWEGAVVCALLITPLAGPTTTKIISSLFDAGSAAQEQLAGADLSPEMAADIEGLGVRIVTFGERQAQAIEREWAQTCRRIETSLDGMIGKRPGENASVAMLRSLARHALNSMGLIEASEPTPRGWDSQASPRDPSPPADIDDTPVSPGTRPLSQLPSFPAAEDTPENDRSEGGSR